MLTIFRRKERLCLVLLGILLVSMASALSAATARSVQGAVDEELARHWRTDYDILVRPRSVVSEIEVRDGSVSGKFQSNHFADHNISVLQLDAIRAIDGVEVAAPLAVVGPAFVSASVGVPLVYEGMAPGVYKEIISVTENNGIEDFTVNYTRYFVIHDNFEEEFGYRNYGELDYNLFYKAGLFAPPYQYRFSAMQSMINVVAVDFEAEAALHGLDKALIEGSLPPAGGSYKDGTGNVVLPMLLNKSYVPGGTASVNLSMLLDLPPTRETVEMLSESEINLFKDARTTHVSAFDLDLTVPLTLPDFGELFAHSRTRAPEGLVYTEYDGKVSLFAYDVGGGFSLTAYDQDVTGLFDLLGRNQVFRQMAGEDSRDRGRLSSGIIDYTYAGLFDPDLLAVSAGDSPVAAPLEIYRPSPERVLRGQGGSELPGETFSQFIHPYDFVGAPIAGLVPLEAIYALSDVGIDSVRVRVSGVDEMNEQSQLRIAYIAQQIEELTGLQADIVLGSSQQRKPIHLYGYNNAEREQHNQHVQSVLQDSLRELERKTGMAVSMDFYTMEIGMYTFFVDTSKPLVILPRGWSGREEARDELASLVFGQLRESFATLGYTDLSNEFQEVQCLFQNWHKEITVIMPEYEFAANESRDLYGVVEQYWMKLGTQIRIYEETNRGTFWITLGLLVVGTLFIGNTTYISAVGRIGEFSTLRSLGWRRSTVFRVSLTETFIISLLAGVVTAGILALVWMFSDRYLDSTVLLLVAPAVIITFLVGSFPPLLRTIFIPPLQGVRQGEQRVVSRFGGARPLGFVLRGLALRPGRTLVTSLAMLIPGGLLAFAFFVYFGVQALMGETLLGEYLALEFRAYHFILNALVFAVAGLAVTDTLLMNLRERQKELGLLKAVGWRSSTVASLLLWEGAGLGLLGGFIGTSVAALIYTSIFSMLPPNVLFNGAVLALIPAGVGGLAAIIPALRAARIPAAEVIRDE